MNSKGYGDNLHVSDKDFIDAFGMQQWQLDKLKEHARKHGSFKFYGYTYTLDPSEKISLKLKDRKKRDPNTFRKSKFIVTDRIKEEDNNIPQRAYYIYVKYNSKLMFIDDFIVQFNISRGHFNKITRGAKSLRINGEYIEITRYGKSHRRVC